jgi:peptidoglycan-N-acetylglucosamine deacetylase
MDPIRWPEGADVAVALTFDLDADVGMSWRGLDGRLTAASEATFGAGRGLTRILRLLDEYGVPATFYVPGEIADLHPREVAGLAGAGHEVGHHGHLHLFTDRVSESEQREELERGLRSLEGVCGVRPRGFRSPGWELTPYTLRSLVELGFEWDSSCMADDVPYLQSDGADVSIVELPVHWSLDDWPFFGFSRDGGGVIQSPDVVLATWKREFLSALAEGRLLTLTMHPEVMGRGYRAHMLGELVGWMRAHGSVLFATHGQVVAHLVATGQVEPGRPGPGRARPGGSGG